MVCLERSNGNPFLWVTALAGAFITAFYCTRLMLVVFGVR